MPAKACQTALGKAYRMCCSQSLGAVWPGPTCPPNSSAQYRIHTDCDSVTVTVRQDKWPDLFSRPSAITSALADIRSTKKQKKNPLIYII